MLITDRLTITDKRRTSDGYLVTEARFARSGIYEYAGSEVGKPHMDKVVVFRPEEEVFKDDAMASFAHRPITNDHPTSLVDATNWKREAVGFTDGRVARDGDFVVVPMMVTDAEAIEDVDGGKVELSAGYDCDLEFIDGVAPNGQKYDAVMRNIRGNHIAIVDRGRAGSECRVGDRDNTGVETMKIMHDGIEIEATPQSAQVIGKLESKLNDATSAATTAKDAHDKVVADKDAELAKKDAEIADLKDKVMDAATLDQKVAQRAKLVADAKSLVSDFDGTGKTDAEIKRAIVQAKCGDAAVTDKSDAYIDARFDALLEAGPTDTVRNHVAQSVTNSDGTTMSVADLKRKEAEARDAANDHNAWREKQTG